MCFAIKTTIIPTIITTINTVCKFHNYECGIDVVVVQQLEFNSGKNIKKKKRQVELAT